MKDLELLFVFLISAKRFRVKIRITNHHNYSLFDLTTAVVYGQSTPSGSEFDSRSRQVNFGFGIWCVHNNNDLHNDDFRLDVEKALKVVTSATRATIENAGEFLLKRMLSLTKNSEKNTQEMNINYLQKQLNRNKFISSFIILCRALSIFFFCHQHFQKLKIWIDMTSRQLSTNAMSCSPIFLRNVWRH